MLYDRNCLTTDMCYTHILIYTLTVTFLSLSDHYSSWSIPKEKFNIVIRTLLTNYVIINDCEVADKCEIKYMDIID